MNRSVWLVAVVLAVLPLAACDVGAAVPPAGPLTPDASGSENPSEPVRPVEPPGGQTAPAPTEDASAEPSEGATSEPSEGATPDVPPSTADCADAVICDDFEDQTGATPGGAWTTTAPDCEGEGTVAVDTAQAHSGSTSVRVDGAAGYCNHIFLTSTSDLGGLGDAWFGRFWVRHTTPLPTAHVTFVSMTDASDGRHLRMGGQNAALQWNRESDDATLPEQSPAGVALSQPLATDTWSCVEFAVDGAAGTIQTWIDGAAVPGLQVDGEPTHDIDGQWLNGGAWSPQLTDLGLGWESYGEGADTLWFDDIALASARVGC